MFRKHHFESTTEIELIFEIMLINSFLKLMARWMIDRCERSQPNLWVDFALMTKRIFIHSFDLFRIRWFSDILFYILTENHFVFDLYLPHNKIIIILFSSNYYFYDILSKLFLWFYWCVLLINRFVILYNLMKKKA